MRPADLYDALILLFEPAAGIDQRPQRRKKLRLQRRYGRNMHGCRESVVGTLRHVDRVIWVQNFLPCQLIPPVGDDLVDIHVRLRTGARLPDEKREFRRKLSGQNFITYIADDFAACLVQLAKLPVGKRRRFFEHCKCENHLLRHSVVPDSEVLKTALCLRAPELVRGNRDLAQRVMFHTILHKASPLFLILCVS